MSDDKKPVLLPCQTCGMEPVDKGFCSPSSACGKQPIVTCRLCRPWSSRTIENWNAKQFRARHEAIDRIVLALFSDHAGTKHVREYMLITGCNACDAPQLLAIDVHESNLARRRAEASKLIGGKA